MHSPQDPSEHAVHFYSRDEDLCAKVAEFLLDGLRDHERVLILATAGHWADIARRVSSAIGAAALDRAIADNDVTFQDADAVVDAITTNGVVDRERFRAMITAALTPLAPPVRVFGEVVALLAARGRFDDAIAIEALGDHLAHTAHVQVLCAYDLRHFDSPAATARVANAHDRSTTAPHGPLILLADDYADARELYRDFLQLRGYRVVTAVDGVDAVEAARANTPAAIVLDIRMPRMTGLDAMQVLKSDPALAAVPMVALTAHAFPAERDLFLARGFNAVLAKPCLPEELAETIESLLASVPQPSES